MAFIREVDEEYRRDEFNRLANRYGRWILLAIVVGLAALGGYLFWDAEKTRKDAALSEQFSLALNQVEAGATSEGLAATAEGDNASYRALSFLTQAGVAINAGESEKAAGLLRAAADDQKHPQAMRDAAKMKLIRLEFDTTEPAAIIQQLAPFMDGDNPWFPIAGEMTALAHVRAGDNEKAGEIFFRIAEDARAPLSLRSRAEQMASMLGMDVTSLAEARLAASQATVDSMASDAQAGSEPVAENMAEEG